MLFFSKSFWMDIWVHDSLGIELVPFVTEAFTKGVFQGEEAISASNGEVRMEVVLDGEDITFVSASRLEKWMTHAYAKAHNIYWHHTPTELWIDKMFVKDLHRETFPLSAIETAYFETRGKEIGKVHVVTTQGARIAAKKKNRATIVLLNGKRADR